MKILIIFYVAIIQFANAQSLSEKIDSYAASYVATGDFSGCITISQDDTVIYSNCFGKANSSFNIDNNSKTRFMIGSISKQFTAVGILILEERGLISTNDTISKYFPEFPNAAKINIGQLLTH